MTSAPRVNSTWLAIYTRVSHRDVHIPCPSYLDKYLASIQTSPNGSQLRCQSITLSMDASKPSRDPYSNEDKALINLLYTLGAIVTLPQLHTLSLSYYNTHPDAVLLQLSRSLEFSPFPSHITNLELSIEASPWEISSLCCHPAHRGRLVWPLPSIRYLTVKGTTEFVIADMLSACPNVETLRIDSSDACLGNTCHCEGVFALHEGTAGGLLGWRASRT
jgi:hypothetical protein